MKENRSVVRVLDILELIAKHDEGLTLGQIYRMLDIPKATAYDVLRTLYKLDAIYYRDPNLKNYVIGSKMFAIGSVYTKNSNFIEAGAFELKDFASDYNTTVFGTKKIEDKVVFVAKYQGQQAQYNAPQQIGTIIYDLESDASGLAYLLFDDKNKEVIAKHKEAYKKGYLELHSNGSLNVLSVAVPVYNFENRVCGVLMTTDIEEQNEEVHEEKVSKLIRIAQNTSRKLGYIGDFKWLKSVLEDMM